MDMSNDTALQDPTDQAHEQALKQGFDPENRAPVHSVTLPPGRYIVGDPCYSISDEKWMDWLEAADFRNNDPDHILAAEHNGRLAIGIYTKYGDGEYHDQDGNEYGVDAGLIGLVPVESADKESVPNPNIITLTEDTEIGIRENGVITLGPVEIDTDPNFCANCNSPADKGIYICDDCEYEEDRLSQACPECEYGGYGDICNEHVESDDEEDED